jgi:hypothetical protein
MYKLLYFSFIYSLFDEAATKYKQYNVCVIIFLSLRLCSPARAMTSSFRNYRDHTQRRATVGRTPLDEL